MRRPLRPRAALLLGAVLIGSACATPDSRGPLPTLAPGSPAFFATLGAHAGSSFVPGNRVDVLLDGDGTFPLLLEALRRARRSVTIAQYIYDRGPIADEVTAALADRCRAGVRVHVLLDAFGSSGLPRASADALRSAGCHLEWYGSPRLFHLLPPWRVFALNRRSHRRIVVVDGAVGFTGGFAISESWMGDGTDPERWRDTNARLEGPAVRQLQAAFVQDWREVTGVTLGGADYFPPLPERGSVLAQVVKSSPEKGSSESYMLYRFAISTARRSIHLANPYFVIDEPMRGALARAVERGVDVTLLIPGRIGHELLGTETSLVQHAGRSGLGDLLRSGVRVFQYRPSRLHAKTMVIDGTWATVGSTNLDPRSFALNRELNLTVYDRAIAARLDAVFRADLERSEELTYARWRARPLRDRVLEWFAWPAKSQL